MKGILFDIKHYAIHDGPGIRTTVFLKGCPLRCQWCANPESQTPSVELMFNPDRCTLCLDCLEACPSQSIFVREGRRRVDPERCRRCGRCADVCLNEALEVTGYEIEPSRLWEEIKDDRIFWERSSGGVTLSGGEPLIQPEFTEEFLGLCRRSGVHTAIETCGHIPEKEFAAVLPLVDLVIFDYKAASPDRHRSVTGVSNDLIMKNLAVLLKTPGEVLIRMPLVPGVNDAPGDLESIGEILTELRPGVSFELLPYHRLGEKKYKKLGREYRLEDLEPPTGQQMKEALAILERYQLRLIPPVSGRRQ